MPSCVDTIDVTTLPSAFCISLFTPSTLIRSSVVVYLSHRPTGRLLHLAEYHAEMLDVVGARHLVQLALLVQIV